MPELAEVEYYRKRWDVGIGGTVIGADLHTEKRVFRGIDAQKMCRALSRSKLLASEARGKQMAFQFSRGVWIGIHLGMTGVLRTESRDFTAGKHDHLVLRQKQRALVFSDPRQFGRVLFFEGRGEPPWWSEIPPALTSAAFTLAVLRDILRRHARLPLKAALLLQARFPGVGNWMADEILWRARIHPRTPGARIDGTPLKILWREIRFVCAGSLKHVSEDFSDPPRGWFYHERWSGNGKCPRDGRMLKRETVGGRTTAWCPQCQRGKG